MKDLEERLQHAQRREQKQADELQQMEEQYAERVRHLKDQNQRLMESQRDASRAGADQASSMLATGGSPTVENAEKILSEQLREMTSVLEEFDTKYSRKEK